MSPAPPSPTLAPRPGSAPPLTTPALYAAARGAHWAAVHRHVSRDLERILLDDYSPGVQAKINALAPVEALADSMAQYYYARAAALEASESNPDARDRPMITPALYHALTAVVAPYPELSYGLLPPGGVKLVRNGVDVE
jgi:hypothetical protein